MKSLMNRILLAAVLSLSFWCQASEDVLLNPERGFRFEFLVGLEEGESQSKSGKSAWRFSEFRTSAVTVAQAYCYLTKYCECETIAPSKIEAIERDFERARKMGVKFLFRFAYERNMSRKSGPTLERILAHAKQLTPLIRKNSDVIYVFQMGWVGAWGEFHSSFSGIENSPEATAKIAAATLAMLPDNRYTQARTSYIRKDMLDGLGGDCEVTAKTAWTLVPTARIGYFNDATFANFHDAGTFLGDRAKLAKMSWDQVVGHKFDVPGGEVFDRMARESAFVPVDGELFWNGHVDLVRQSALAAIQRFTRHHYSTFSLVHGFSELDMTPQFGAIDAWKKTPVTAELLKAYSIPFDEGYFSMKPVCSGFEYIRDHLGYRLALERLDSGAECRRGEKFSATAKLRNWGFAAPVNRREAYFVLLFADGKVKEIPTGFDCRRLSPGKSHEISFSAKIPLDAPEGCCKTALWFPDEAESLRYRPEYAIGLAAGAHTEVVGGRRLQFGNPNK